MGCLTPGRAAWLDVKAVAQCDRLSETGMLVAAPYCRSRRRSIRGLSNLSALRHGLEAGAELGARLPVQASGRRGPREAVCLRWSVSTGLVAVATVWKIMAACALFGRRLEKRRSVASSDFAAEASLVCQMLASLKVERWLISAHHGRRLCMSQTSLS